MQKSWPRFAALLILYALTRCGKEQTSIVQDLISESVRPAFIQNTGCVNLGSASSLDHIAGQWQTDTSVAKDGSDFFVAHTRNVFFFDSVALEDQRLEIRYKSQTPHPNTVKVFINDNPIGEQSLPQQWLRAEWMIPQKYLQLGENVLHIEGTGRPFAAAIDSICVDEKAATSSKTAAASKSIPIDSVVPLHLRVPKNAALKVNFGIDENPANPDSSARFEIWIDQEDQEPKQLFSQLVEQGLFSSPSSNATLDLSKFSGNLIRIRMVSKAVNAKDKSATVYWNKAQLSFPSLVQNERHVSQSKTVIKKPRNIFIYLIDTLRADHLQPYGYSRATSPRISEFAQDAVLFKHAYSQTTWTRSSVACIQTGVYQSSHLIEDRDDVLPSFLTTIQETLKSNQFFTIGIVTNANLIRRFQLARGFEIYNSISGSKKKPGISPHSAEIYALAEQALRGNKNRQPLYMYVHVMDPHYPYAPEVGAPTNLTIPECIADPKSRDCQNARYDGEVFNSDYYFGKFIDLIKEMGLYKDSLIILTADHGESLGEHGARYHGTTLYNSEISVPLLIKFPEEVLAEKEVAATVGHIDIFPTILSLLSKPIPSGIQGKNLTLMLELDSPEPRQIFAEILLDNTDKKAMIEGNYKVIESIIPNKLTGKTRTYYEIYDLNNDPGELRNLSFEKPVLFGYMKSQLKAWSSNQEARKAKLKKPEGAEIDEETRELLRSLGYAQN